MILFVNCCVRENSRTKKLADYLISKLRGDVSEVRPGEEMFPVIDGEFIEKREKYEARSDYDHFCFDFAKQFAQADSIVIAAPYWDLSFPASLKQYFELVNVIGITFGYNEEGLPFGMCSAKTVYYVSTSGGNYYNEEYGYGYVKALAETFYGIQDVKLIKAVGLDIVGADQEKILADAEKYIDSLF